MAAQTKFSAFVGILERGLVMVVDKVEQPDLVGVDLDIGVRYPPHRTAIGKVLLAGLSVQDLMALIDRNGFLKKSPDTIASSSRLLEELGRVRELGYATSDGELYLGVRAIAAPIVDPLGHVRAAVSATGGGVPIDDPKLIDRVRSTASEISKRIVALGFRDRNGLANPYWSCPGFVDTGTPGGDASTH
jgi:IclR family pca regulon transcriptional regulator